MVVATDGPDTSIEICELAAKPLACIEYRCPPGAGTRHTLAPDWDWQIDLADVDDPREQDTSNAVHASAARRTDRRVFTHTGMILAGIRGDQTTCEGVGLLLCDLDDTLLDREGTFAVWLDGFLHGRGIDGMHRQWLLEYDDHGYRSRTEFFAAVRKRLALVDPVDDLVSTFYRQFGPLFRCEPDTRAALQRARDDGWRVAIVTNGSLSQESKIVASGLAGLVDTWCISEVEGLRKPDPALLRLAAQRCGVTLDSAWVIGDTPAADIAAAHAAGLPSVWIRRGRTWSEPAYAPTREADSFPQAVELVLTEGDLAG